MTESGKGEALVEDTGAVVASMGGTMAVKAAVARACVKLAAIHAAS